jgi:hypothetical protein
MNGVKELMNFQVKQTAKGVWYCDGITITAETPDQFTVRAREAMIAMTTILREFNFPAEPDKQEAE